MNEKISVVIPVYNAQAYLRQAVDSVRCQTWKNIEIILVNDGSTDGSGGICDEYAARDPRIKVLHRKNKGLTAAWKRGVREASGVYVGFVDSDDWVEPEMFERMYVRAVEEGADIVCCGIRHVFEGDVHKPWDDEMGTPGENYTNRQMEKELYPVLINDGSFMGRTLQPNRVSKLVRRELVRAYMNLCDDGVSVGEDFQFSLSIFPEAAKISVIKGYCPYYYRVNVKSMTGGYDREYLGKIKYMKSQLERISDEKGVYDFKPQILNDFLCLCVLHIKGEIVRNKKAGYRDNRRNMDRICKDPEVERALFFHTMNRLSYAERLFLFWMRHRYYLAIYLAVRIYFRKDGV